LFLRWERKRTRLVVHSAHAAHAAAGRAACRGLVLLRQLGHDAFGREEQAADGGRVLQRGAGHLGRVDDAGLDQVGIFAGRDVVTLVALAVLDLVDDDGAFSARVLDERAQGLLDGAADDLDADRLVTGELELVEGLLRADEGDAAAGDDAFLDGRAGGVERVLDAGLLFLQRGLGRGADVDDGDTAGQLGQAFLQLFLVVVAGGFLDLAADLADPALDVGVLAFTLDDRGVFLVDDDPLGAAEIFQADVLELDAEVLAEETAAGEDGNVFQDRLAAVAEAGGLDGADLDGPAQLVTTRVASASPSTSSAMMRSGRLDLAVFSSSGRRSFRLLIFFSWMRT